MDVVVERLRNLDARKGTGDGLRAGTGRGRVEVGGGLGVPHQRATEQGVAYPHHRVT